MGYQTGRLFLCTKTKWTSNLEDKRLLQRNEMEMQMYMSQHKDFGTYRIPTTKARASLRLSGDSPEPSLLAFTKYG